MVPYGRVLNLEDASDVQRNFNDFQKRLKEATRREGERIAIEKIMSLFSLNELIAIKKPSITDECAYFLWLVFGGSARNFDNLTPSGNFILPVVNDAMEYFFKDTEYKQAFPKVLVVMSKEFIKQGDDSINVINSIMSHRIDDQQKIWASKFMAYLAGVILDSKEISLWNMLETMLGSKVGGVVFESLAHKLLTSSTEPTKIMPLFKKYSREKPDYNLIVNFNLPITFIRSIDDMKSLKAGYYGLPVFDNFPLVDAVIQPNILVQYATSPEDHKGAVNKLESIRNNLLEKDPEKHMMIFVIPIENIKTFKFQNDLDILQFVTSSSHVASVTALMDPYQLEKYNVYQKSLE
jgi:hypothetical protein